MKLNPQKIKEMSRKDFRKTWLETADLIPKTGGTYVGGKGKPHMMHELIQKVRRVFLECGFDEIENQIFIPQEDVYRQYGPEAPVILDRCYFLGGLTRPDIGLGKDAALKISEIAKVEIDKLKDIFRRYREGSIEGDDVLETMVDELKIRTDEAAKIIGLFPQFKNIKPVCSKMTLRSHMTAAWFPTLMQMQDEAPLKLFSIGLRFRREQKVDSSHLRAHYGGSCAVMGEDVSLEAGMELTKKILDALDFGGVKYVKKKATSNYYAPDTEYEVYSGDIEVADIGMYSPCALAEYGIEYNVFNLGFGLERILMVKEGFEDVREVLYPQLYSPNLTDEELAAEIKINQMPQSDEGKIICQKLVETFKENGSAESPCSFNAYCENGWNIEVVEEEEKSRLLGPAALNDIYVYGGGIYGIPQDISKLKQDMTEILEKGVKLDFNFLDAVCAKFATDIENSQGRESSVKMAKTPGDLNISITGRGRKFISSNNKSIFLKGPVFCSVKYLKN